VDAVSAQVEDGQAGGAGDADEVHVAAGDLRPSAEGDGGD